MEELSMVDGPILQGKMIAGDSKSGLIETLNYDTPNMIKLVPTDIMRFYKMFSLSKDQTAHIKNKFREHLENGLSDKPEVASSSDLKMLVTYVNNIPALSHNGCYYAIDLGGTNIRFFRIDLNKEKFSYSSRQHVIPEEIKTGSRDAFFDYVAYVFEEGLDYFKIPKSEPIPYVGYTFSFPLNQKSLYSGILTNWTKGFDIDGVVGEDVVVHTKKALEKKGIIIEKLVVVNDTTGTMLCGGLTDDQCVIGVICGTGSNACYIEKLDKIPKYKTNSTYPDQVIINIEWGAFGDCGVIDDLRTEYDRVIDNASVRPKEQVLEKMISGMYLGEIARLVLVDMVKANVLFGGKLSEKLALVDSLPSYMVSLAYETKKLKEAFKTELDIDLNGEDETKVSVMFHKIVYRAAKLVATVLTVIMERIPRRLKTIAVDGSLFKNHPYFTQYVYKIIKKSVGHQNVCIELVNDGSGKGAALAACVAKHIFSSRNPYFDLGSNENPN